MNILVANLGSTSVKYRLYAMPSEDVVAEGKIERVTDYREAVAQLKGLDASVDAVAFKAVHGGPAYCGTYVADDALLAAMEEYLVAAPLHNRIYLDGIRAFQQAMPGVPLVAAFETEFHKSIPGYASCYGIPDSWRDEHGVKKYGFHGASHQYVAERTPQVVGAPAETLRLVSCHLGGSSSICAIRSGHSIDVTMGFSPQSGIENATRHGDMDVYGLLHLSKRLGLSVADLEHRLEKEGGLAGLSGIQGGDMRDIVQAAESGNAAATRTFDLFCYQVKKTIGAYAAAMEGLDVVAFTGGIGENRFRVRSMVCLGLKFLGVEINEELNVLEGGDRIISETHSRVKALVIHTNEELIVARRAARVLAV